MIAMTYFLTVNESIAFVPAEGSILVLPPEDNGTPEWRAYQEWLDAGNEPAPYIPPSPAPDYTAFWEGLMASSLYAAIREQSMVSLPMNTLGTEFIALLGDAKAGRPYEAAIQASMLAILSVGTFTEQHIAELQTALEAGHLDEVYTLQVPGP